MKAKVFESKFGLSITLEPENKHELLQLLRYSNNAKMKKPSVHMSFNKEPYCSIYLDKVKESVQINHISKS